ncbi:MAG: SDR family NAD(P)-dependent oxidoreductase [Deltaproteobacteria bacterium]|nr:SDR family NAD(P)-dependent oxidoreductase [Deltaproteobacteria bacterium]
MISAIKSHVGHLYGGSAAASALSTLLSLKHRRIPGIRHLENIRPELGEFLNRAIPVKETTSIPDSCQAAGLTSLGLGGANYFAVLTEGVNSPSENRNRVIEKGGAFVGKAVTRASDIGTEDVFICLVEKESDFLGAIERAVGQGEIPNVITEGAEVKLRMTISFSSQKSLSTKLKSVITMLEGGHSLKPLESQGVYVAPANDDGKLAFCLPGQGVHYISMGRFLYDSEPLFKDIVDRVHNQAMEAFKFDLIGHIYAESDAPELLKNLGTLIGAQTSLYAIEVALAKLLISKGIIPDVMIGHSFGEVSALAIAGVWTVEDGYKAVVGRIKAAETIAKAKGPALAMASMVCTEEQRDALLKVGGANVVLTNVNAPGRFIFGGVKEDIVRCVELADTFGVDAKLLPIGSAFHSKYMEPAREPFKKWLKDIPCKEPEIPILSTITGEYIESDNFNSDFLAELLSNQLVTPLNLPREINRLYKEGVTHYLEVGPKWAMTKMIDAILSGTRYMAVPSLHPKVGDEEAYRRARAFLIATGHLPSAAAREDIPGMFPPDFIEYMEKHEPSVISLIQEVYNRYHDSLAFGGSARVKSETAGKAVLNKTASPVAAPKKVEAAPASASPSPVTGGNGAGVDVWKERLRSKLVTATGYPQEMLEDDLDLEADLGVDSVQRAEIWVDLITEHGLSQEARHEGPRTISSLAATLSGIDGGGASVESAPEEAPAVPAVVEAVPAVVEAVPAVVEAAPASASPSPVIGGNGAGVDVWKERLRSKLVTATGYPEEMLEDDLDLEADLGVDSVQRAEIWVDLITEHGLSQEARHEGPRTISSLAATLSNIDGGEKKKPEIAETTPVGASESFQSSQKHTVHSGFAFERVPRLGDTDSCHLYSPGAEFIDEASMDSFNAKQVLAITSDTSALSGRLRRRLDKREIELSTVMAKALTSKTDGEIKELLEGVDTLVYIAHEKVVEEEFSGVVLEDRAFEQVELIYAVFKRLIPFLQNDSKRIMIPVYMDGKFGLDSSKGSMLGAFPVGFARALDKELTGCKVQIIDAGELDFADAVDKNILFTVKGCELGMTGGGRIVPVLSEVLPSKEHSTRLVKGDVVLVTGGARGIVFECVSELARFSGCKLVLTGRTEPVDGHPDWLDIPNEKIDESIRLMEIDLVKNSGAKLPEAKKIAAARRSQWEVNRNIERLKAFGIEAVYERCDVSNREDLTNLINEIAKTSPIAGIVHGSGIQNSKIIVELADRDIKLTLKTKLTPLFTMLDALDWKHVKLFSAFGSIAGLFGNAGQSDYALGNDMIVWMVKKINSLYPHVKTQTVEWTAWVGTGMVKPQEAKRFKEAGLIPLTVETGVPLFMEAVTGSSQERVAAFNAAAPFAAGRKFTKYPAHSTPRKKLLCSKENETDTDSVEFSIEKDGFINHHLVNLKPVIPGTFVTEIFAETLKGSKYIPSKIRFRRPMQLKDGKLDVEIVKTENSMMALPKMRPAGLEDKALANLSFASCNLELRDMVTYPDLKMPKKILKKLNTLSYETSASFYSLLDEKFYKALKTDSVFRGVRATVEEGDMFYSAVTLTSAALDSLAQPGDYVFNPILADMAVQVAAAWAMLRHDTMEIPYEIGQLISDRNIKGEDALVICKEKKIADDESVMDVVVRNTDGTFIMALNDLVLKTIMKG